MTHLSSVRSRLRAAGIAATLLLVPVASSCGDSPAQVLAKFCSASSGGVETPAIAATDDAAAVKEKVAAMADSMKSLAGKAPKEVKDDVKFVSNTASDLASALSDSESLTDIVKAMKSLSSQNVDAASQRINTFITTNCKASS